jgi:hypothetical protein
MPHHKPDPTAFHTALELLTDHGFENMAGALQILMNEAMELERSAFLQAGPFMRVCPIHVRLPLSLEMSTSP